jgi:hypothetical protein
MSEPGGGVPTSKDFPTPLGDPTTYALPAGSQAIFCPNHGCSEFGGGYWMVWAADAKPVPLYGPQPD